MTTTLIKKGYLLDPCLPFERGDILIKNDLIAQVAPDIDFPADTIINASNKVILPGLISAHTHSFMTWLRGLTDNLPLDSWLLYIGYVMGERMSLREQYVWSAIGALELLKNGTTSLVESGPVIGRLEEIDNRVDATANAFADVGIRAAIAPLYLDLDYSEGHPLHLLGDIKPEHIAPLNLFPPEKAENIIQALRGVLRRWQDDNPRLSLYLGCEPPYRASRELLEGTVELASEFDLGIHMHLLEAKFQVIISHKMFSCSPVDYLASINCLGPHVSLAHVIWVDDKDIQVLAETNTSVIHNPIANLRLGDGIAPVQAMKARGLNIALGIDDVSNCDSLSMFESMKFAASIHKLYGHRSKWIGAQDALTMCLHGGAKVMRKKIGSLQPGCLADLVILGTDKLFIIPKEYFINQLVFGELGSSVETVLVGGHVVIEDKEVKTVNEKELYAEARESMQKLYTDIPSLNKRFAPALDLLDRMDKAVADYKLPFSRLACLD